MRILPRLTRRRFLGLLGGAAALGYYTWRVEPHWVEFVHSCRSGTSDTPPARSTWATGGTSTINRALGHLRRVRFNVRPEITVFRLTAA